MRMVRPSLALLGASAMTLAACGQPGEAASTTSSPNVVASFYPLQWVSEQVGGNRVDVTSLTPPGAEPHDLELSPQDVAGVTDADLVVYLSGFQPAVDDSVDSEAGDAGFDVADSADLSLTYEGDEHEGEEHEGEEGHDDGASVTDPHFWLDPLRLADVGDAVAVRMGEVDPDGAETYTENATAVRTQLEGLDAEMTGGLAACENTTLVTAHNAFGYLADRYGFTPMGVSGLSPEDEPSPADLAEVADFVTANSVGTIYFETLVSPDVAQTVADETGAATAALDPIEGLTDASAGDDYVSVMRSNLEALRAGQSCA